jgi:hypothetical protein
MRGVTVSKIEDGVMAAAATTFAAAVGFAAYRGLDGMVGQPALVGLTAAAMAIGIVLCGRLLNRIGRGEPKFHVPIFDLGAMKSVESDELVLTEAQRLKPVVQSPPPEEPLELNDVLHEVGPDTRVVRLFDPGAMPTPAQLKARIDRHLEGGLPPASPDASQALYDALAELRLSLN